MAEPNGTTAELAAHVARLQAAFTRELTEDDLRAIARKLTEQAREGDRSSARLVLKYSLGAAAEAKRPTKPDHGLVGMSPAEFVANAGKILREYDKMEADMCRQPPGTRPTGPPTGQPRR
jgi:hypothetical protein